MMAIISSGHELSLLRAGKGREEGERRGEEGERGRRKAQFHTGVKGHVTTTRLTLHKQLLSIVKAHGVDGVSFILKQ